MCIVYALYGREKNKTKTGGTGERDGKRRSTKGQQVYRTLLDLRCIVLLVITAK